MSPPDAEYRGLRPPTVTAREGPGHYCPGPPARLNGSNSCGPRLPSKKAAISEVLDAGVYLSAYQPEISDAQAALIKAGTPDEVATFVVANPRDGAGLGWVAATMDGVILGCGQDTMKVCRRGDITLGELGTIRRGMASARSAGLILPQHSVTVLSDTRLALNTLRKVRDGVSLAGLRADKVKEAEVILSKIRHQAVCFEWVKGHRGHRLNEAADRLAVMAGRNKEFTVPREAADRMFAELQPEVVQPFAA